MEHPGVKNLLDRIFKQNGGQVNKAVAPAPSDNPADGLTIVFDKKTKSKSEENHSNNAFSNFKENLKQRMKARRQEIRKEEEEDDKINEEYHETIKKAEDENEEEEIDSDVEDAVDEKRPNKIEESDSDEDDTCGKNDQNNSDGDSDTDFQLNLNDEDEESESELVLVNKNGKKSSGKQTAKRDLYEFDGYEEDTQEDLRKGAKANGEIPLTNTIPSNQPKGDFDFDSQEYLEGTQFLIDKQQRRSLDEITNISFNYETTQQQSAHNISGNTLNSFKSKASSTTNLTILNNSEDANGGCDDFDELAMLCSGQFKQDTQQKSDKDKTDNSSKIIETPTESQNKSMEINLADNDLYAADDPDEDDQDLKKVSTFFNQDSNSSESNVNRMKKNLASPEDSSSDTEAANSESKQMAVDSEDDQAAVVVNKSAFDALKKVPVERHEDEEDTAEGKGFFEVEAELSGSEEDPDENYEGESGDDNSLVYSGDEDLLPGADQLKDQLGKIYLKDQMDEDKRQLRMFKEMYLGVEETEKKDNRKKQFRWKNADTFKEGNRFSSEEEDEDEEEDEEATDDTKNDTKKNEKYMKLMENRNWRLIRHEREQFVKLKANAETLLSEDELQDIQVQKKQKRFKRLEHYKSDSSDSETETTKHQKPLTTTNSLFKIGQSLLKKKPNTNTLNKSEQNKRASNGEIVMASSKKSSITITRVGENTEAAVVEETTAKVTNNSENLLKKFSFLNRDKGYLSKLSSYVNKNFANADQANTVKTKSRNTNGMVFTKVDLTGDDEENDSDNRGPKAPYTNSASVNRQSSALNNDRVENTSTTSKITITPTPKRTKYDTCESIFNHIN